MLVIFRQAPYGTSYTGEGVRVLSSLAAFEVDVQVVFMDDGVFGLKKGQNPEELDMKSLGKGLQQVLSFGAQTIFVDANSLQERGINKEDLIDMDITLVDSAKIHDLMEETSAVLTF
ncbi:MAG: sulfurtransferase complex subunit TusC [Candidatus Methanofastidiosia archaeon]|jgi:tRNA 2-thiouridine synthesizing protein C